MLIAVLAPEEVWIALRDLKPKLDKLNLTRKTLSV